MATPPLTRDQAAAALAALAAAGGNISAAARSLKISRSALHNRLRRAAEYGLAPPSPMAAPAGFVVGEQSVRFDAAGGIRGQTIRFTREPGETFTPLAGHLVKGESAFVDAEGRVRGKWVKTDLARAAAIREAFTGYAGLTATVAPRADVDADLLTAYILGDPHFGMYAWGAETGAAYDTDIATDLHRRAMAELVAMSPPSESAVLLGLGDFLHSDTADNRTPQSGHPLDVDTRMPKVKRAAVELLIAMIDQARQSHARVIVRLLPGNHDPESAHMLAIALDCFYASEPRVEVDLAPHPYFVHRHGKVLLFANHTDRIKPADMPGVAAGLWPKEWGETVWRYAHCGHRHHAASGGGERNGMQWEVHQTLAPKDAWHHAMGYSSNRSMKAVTYHRDKGEVFRHMISPEGLG